MEKIQITGDDLFILKLINGECINEMDKLINQGIKVDMILCDLPYGTTACKWDNIIPFDKLWRQYERLIKDNSAIILFGTQPFTSDLILSNPKMFKHELIWHKNRSGSCFTAKYRPVSKHENILVFGKGKITYNPQMVEGKPYRRVHKVTESIINNHNIGFNKKESITDNKGERYPGSVQYFPQNWRRQDQFHPTQKPVELCEWLINSYTNEGGLILDNCMGSGTTGVACKKLNRSFIGIELDEKYYLMAEKRIENV